MIPWASLQESDSSHRPKKADRKRLYEAERQTEASTKTMRQARRTTRAASAEASASDYAAGEF